MSDNFSIEPNVGPVCPVAARSAAIVPLDTLRERLPRLDALFTNLATSGQFNFLDIMAAISEIVAFLTDCDQNSIDARPPQIIMSEKKCLFCC